MIEVTDQMGRKVKVPKSPQRIISLVPSQTELLYDLGLGDRVVGLTKFCVHPAHWRSEKMIVGGTKQYHFDRIEGLKPDLIIGNKEENEKEAIERLADQYPVWMSDIITLEDSLSMIDQVGDLVDKSSEARTMSDAIRKSFQGLSGLKQSVSAIYLIWKGPYMAAGSGTFIDDMMRLAGYKNCITESRYPNLSIEDIQSINPQSILLSSEPYPFKGQHIEALQKLLPDAEIQLVDGELFSWYGSRLRRSAEYFKQLRK